MRPPVGPTKQNLNADLILLVVFQGVLTTGHLLSPTSLVLAVSLCLFGCSSSPGGLSGNYQQDTLAVVQSLRTAIELPADRGGTVVGRARHTLVKARGAAGAAGT